MARLVLGLFALAFGLLLGSGDAFLSAWRTTAGEAHDIAARGPWLLVVYVPYFVVGAAAFAACVAAVPRRRNGGAAFLAAAMACGVVLFVAGVLYADPSARIWQVLAPARDALGSIGARALDAILALGGLWLVAGQRGPRGKHPAPAI